MKNITINGREYTVRAEYDEDMGAPWEEHDGHGIVSEWTSRDKRAGELILHSDRGSKRFYDFAATMKKAKEEGWGLALVKSAGLTPGQILEKAVMQDYEYLRAWCNGEWQWQYVIVTAPDGERESLGGISSGEDDYLQEVAQELAEELESAYQDKQTEEATL